MLRSLSILLLLPLAACTFDGSALDDRPPCSTDEDCPTGVCIEGSCFGAETLADATADVRIDTGADVTDTTADATTDVPSPDVITDAGGECSPGRRVCDGNAVYECDAEGDQFVLFEQCEGESECVGGECIETECNPGDRFCAGDILVRCNADGVAVAESDCAANSAYCSEDIDAHCQPRVCEPDALRCDAEAPRVERCDARGTGWTVVSQCGEGQLCDDGACVETECEAGEQRCIGPFVYASCQEDGQSVDVIPCGDGNYCLETGVGAIDCREQQCEPNARRCAATGEAVELCDDRGTGYTNTIPCEPGDYCLDGFCTAQVCEPNTVRCAGPDAYLECDSRGAAGTLLYCEPGNFCQNAAEGIECVPQVCTPGDDRRCGSSTLVEICNEAGSGYTDTELCDSGTGCNAGFCTSLVCEPGTFQCLDETLRQECNPSGTLWTDAPCAENQFCDGGACVDQLCEPGARRCDGLGVYECNATGSAEIPIETCDFTCSEGACQANVCGDGVIGTADGETCDDGNDDPCDGCDACNRQYAVSVSTPSSAISSETWEPGGADFTFEAWVNVTSENGALFGLGQRSAADHVWVGVTGGVIEAEIGLSAEVVLRATGSTRVTDTGWHHVALQRFDTWGIALFVDGEFEGFSHEPQSASSLGTPLAIWIGSEGVTAPASARLDEVRLSGVRRYTSVFAPPYRVTADGDTLAMYRANGANAALLDDTSGNGRHLTATEVNLVADACYGATAGARTCGDGAVAPWEQCDGGDGCTACVVQLCRNDERRGINNKCYFINTRGRRWGQAADDCDDRPGDSHLITMNNAAENDWVTFFMDLNAAHWIGLSDDGIGNEGDYYWETGSSNYRHWAAGEPNDNGFDNEDCVVVYGSSSGASASFWNDARCEINFASVCERTP